MPPIARVVVDTNVLIAAFLSARSSPAQIVKLIVDGDADVVMSAKLKAELTEVLSREKFRRYSSLDVALNYIESLWGLAEQVEDPDSADFGSVCRDPKDDYLVFLAEEVEATMLISGDLDVLAVKRGSLDVRSPADALSVLTFEHPWGRGVIPATAEQVVRQIQAEGHSAPLEATRLFIRAMSGRRRSSIKAIVTPESYNAWIAQRAQVAADLALRGLGTKPEYPSPGVAFVKLPPDPGQIVRAVGRLEVRDMVAITLLLRPNLPHNPLTGGWRAHAVSSFLPDVNELPTTGREPTR